MDIRPYRNSDRDACMEIFRSNVPLFFDPVEEPAFGAWLLEMDDRRNRSGILEAEYYFVVEKHSGLLACGGFHVNLDTNQARMCWGMVHRALHRSGIGSSLLLFRLNEIKSRYPACAISLDTSQHAYRFFEQSGFSLQSVTSNYYAPGMDKYEMLLAGSQKSEKND